MYAMVWSALPYFSVCADGSSQVQLNALLDHLTPCIRNTTEKGSLVPMQVGPDSQGLH